MFGPGAGLADESWGTQDPQCAFDLHTQRYFLSYTAWAGPSKGWAQKAAVSSSSPANASGWHRLGFTFPSNNSWPTSPRGAESNIKCSALYTRPDPLPNHTPRYFLYSGDVTLHGARVSHSNSLDGPWSARELVKGGGVKNGAWDAHMGCFTPPVPLTGSLRGHLLTFYNAYPPKYPGAPGFQVGWCILNASDPTQVIARSKRAVLSTHGVAWMEGDKGYYCNNPCHHLRFICSNACRSGASLD
eukprot:COSAG01_NODE_9274_length_2496_cov_1.989153_2_plen_244_part_00